MRLIVLISSLFCLVSCSKSYNKLSWLDKYKVKSKNTRSFASDEECFIDQFEINQIKTEIVELEKQFTKKVSIDNKWNFTEFNAAETHYIKRYGKIIKLSEEAKLCKSLVCVLNSAYGHQDGDEGYRIYHWFLTMGSGISTSRDIPRYADMTDHGDKDFLFPLKELKALNILSKVMSKKYRDMKVQSLHRFPDGKQPDVGTAGLFWRQWWSNGKKDNGYIYITKQNNSIDNRKKLLSGYFTNVVIHEHTHALDYTLGPDTFKKNTISDNKEWTDLSWKWVEVTNTYTRTLEDGTEEQFEKTEMDWRPDDSKSEGFVTGYQRTSPAEDYADAGAYYIINPKSLFNKSPKKYKLFKKYYYNRGLTKKDFVDQNVESIVNKISPDLWEIVKSCLIDKTTKKVVSSFVSLKALNFLMDDARICLEGNLEEKIERELFFAKKEQYHACHYLKDQKTHIASKVVDKVFPKISNYLDQIGDYEKVQKLWSTYREELRSNCDPSHIYLSVRKNENAKSDYESEFLRCVDMIHANYTTYGELFKKEKDLYVDSHPFETIEENTLFAISNMMKGFTTVLLRSSEELVDSCRYQNEEELDTKGPVFGSGIYVASGVLNCINKNFYNDLDSQLKDYMDEKYRYQSEALLYLTEKYTPVYIDLVNKELFKINQTESKNFHGTFVVGRRESFKNFYENLEILGDIYKNKTDSYCIEKMKPLVINKIEKSWKTTGTPLTIASNELANSIVEQLCPELLELSTEKYAVEYKNLEVEINNYINQQEKKPHTWTGNLVNEENFSVQCHTHNLENTQIFTNSLVQGKDIYFVTPKSLKNKVINLLCEKLAGNFNSQINQIKQYSSQYSESIARVVTEDLNWQAVYNKTEYIKSCMLKSQLKVNKDFITTNNELKEFNLVSAPLISKHLAVKACDQLYRKWEKSDLVFIKEISNSVEPLILINSHSSSSVWQNYMKIFYKEVLRSGADLLVEKFNDQVTTCKGKYPYMRFKAMKVNRKKCINKFFETIKVNKNESGLSEIHPNIRSTIDNLTKTEIELLKQSLNTYLSI